MGAGDANGAGAPIGRFHGRVGVHAPHGGTVDVGYRRFHYPLFMDVAINRYSHLIAFEYYRSLF